MSGSWPPEDFPRLRPEDHQEKSAATSSYNCIAWAAEDASAWWWPDDPDIGYGYWPAGAPREETVAAFFAAYRTLGYGPCEGPAFERGFKKIALYAKDDGTPTHAALQLPNGSWTSKLGDFENIEHRTLSCLEGPCYGRVVAYMKRKIAAVSRTL